MSANAIAGVGTVFQRYNPTSLVWEDITEINSINGQGLKREVIDVSSFDTEEGYREYIPGFMQGDTVVLGMNFTRDGYEVMLNDFASGDERDYKIILLDTDNTEISFNGLVNELPMTIPIDDKITSDVTIKISGKPTFGISVPTGLTFAGISGGVRVSFTDESGGVAEHEIWAQSNGGTSALLTTLDAGDVLYDDTIAPVDLRYYKVRAKIGTSYSAFTAESSIAMLGAELCGNPTFTTAAWWTIVTAASITAGVLRLTAVAVNDGVYNAYTPTNGKTYRIVYTISGYVGGKAQVALGGVWSTDRTSDGTFTELLVAGGAGYVQIYGRSALNTFDVDNFSFKEVLFP